MVEQQNEYNLLCVINNTPNLLRSTINLMETPQEKYMSLYAITVIAGALMPNVWTNYDGKVNHPALMLLVSFPPAAGKGKLALLPLVLNKINEELRVNNNALMKQYMMDLKEYLNNKKSGNTTHPPEKPRLKLLLIPANTTSSKLTEQLAENNGEMMALLFETETDALTNMMGSKFGGDNSMIFRKVFHHEQISQMRKLNSEHFEVISPKMAIVITGTPSQIPKLFHSNQDGLLSRFMVISGTASLVWKDVQPCDSCVPLNKLFEGKAAEYYKVFHFFRNKNLEVKFTTEQWTQLNKIGAKRLEHSNVEGGENATSIAKRHGNMTVRIATIFSALRYYESNSADAVIVCSDEDFKIASWMVEQSYQSCIELFKELPGERNDLDERMQEVFDMLPNKFKTKELTPIYKSLGVSQRTLERILVKLKKAGRLSTLNRGEYEKVMVSEMTDVGTFN